MNIPPGQSQIFWIFKITLLDDGLILQIDHFAFGNVTTQPLTMLMHSAVISCDLLRRFADGSQMIVHVDLAGSVAIVDGVASRSATATHEARRPSAAILERFLEGGSEFPVEVGVDQGIEGRIEVADPEDQGYHGRGTVAFLGAAE